MSIIGDLERFFAEVIFPYRLPLAIAVGLAALATLLVAWRGRWDRPLRRHPRRTLAIALPVLAVLVPVGWVLGSPLFIRTELNEPAADIGSTDAGTAILTGEFQGADEFHFGEGTATIIATPDGSHELRFTDFSVLNGPDLHVYLSPSAEGYAEGALDLGRLKATDGAFGYTLDSSLSLDEVRSVVIWCEPFGVQFAHAPLAAAAN